MDGDGFLPVVFIGVAVAIVAAALLLSRLGRRTIDRPLPGARRGGFWMFSRGDDDGGGND